MKKVIVNKHTVLINLMPFECQRDNIICSNTTVQIKASLRNEDAYIIAFCMLSMWDPLSKPTQTVEP